MTLGVAPLALVLLLLPSGTMGGLGAAGALRVRASLTGGRAHARCPAGAPRAAECFFNEGAGLVPGLGSVEQRFMLVVEIPSPSSPCRRWSTTDLTLTVAGKGEIEVSATSDSCQPPTPSGSMAFTVTGGSGLYEGASGSGTVRTEARREVAGIATYTWTGTLTVPGLEFDVTPPTLSGIQNKMARLPGKARRAAVIYAPTAQDAVDGAVPVACKPPSGSLFKLGRTRVACSATDSSGNTAAARFFVMVTRR